MSTVLEHRFEMLEKASNNTELVDAAKSLIEPFPEKREDIGFKFFARIDPQPFIQGKENDDLTSALIPVLLFLAKVPQFATNRKMLEFISLIGKMINDFSDATDSDTGTVEECYGVLECVARYPAGLEAIMESDVGERVEDDFHGLNHLFLKYTESIDIGSGGCDHDSRTWQKLEFISSLFEGVVMKLIRIDPDVSWRCKLQDVIVNLFCSKLKLSEKHRNLALKLALNFMAEFNLQWAFEGESNRKFLETLVQLASVTITVSLCGNTYEEVLCKEEQLTCCEILLQALDLPSDPSSVPLPQVSNSLRRAVGAICDFFIPMGEDIMKHKQKSGDERAIRYAPSGNNEIKDGKLKTPESGYSLGAEKGSYEITSVLGDHDFMIDIIHFLMSWYHQHAPVDTTIKTKLISMQPFLLYMGEYIIDNYLEACNTLEPDPDERERSVLWMVINLFADLIKSNEVRDNLLQEQQLILLGRFLLCNWADFKKTQRCLNESSQHQQSLQNVGDKHKKDARHKSSVHDETMRFQKYAISALLDFMANHIMTCWLKGTLCVTSGQMKHRLHTFAITNLPYLETYKNLTEMAYNVMTIGLVLNERLADTDRLSGDVMKPFFEATVSLLSETYELKGKGKKAVIVVNPHFKEFKVAKVMDMWECNMELLGKCIRVFPQLAEYILEIEWLIDILTILREVKISKVHQIHRLGFKAILSACVEHNAECKTIVRQNNGIQLADKFQYEALRAKLLS